MNPIPEISVIMHVYNAEACILNAIQSILIQTFTRFEFIIINDKSTDKSLNIIKTFDDKRIKVFDNAIYVGKYQSYNIGLKESKGKYICIMDTEFPSLHNRLEEQYTFLLSNPEVGMTGCGYKIANAKTKCQFEVDPEFIKVKLFIFNCFVHSTLMINKAKIECFKLEYDKGFHLCAEYDFIVRASQCFTITNMHNTLVQRDNNKKPVLSESTSKQLLNENSTIFINQLKFLNIEPNIEEQEIHLKLVNNHNFDYAQKDLVWKWILKLLSSNNILGYYNQELFYDMLIHLWNRQYFFNEKNFKTVHPISNNNIVNKINLLDFTFIIPIRIESDYRKKNLETLLRIMNRDYNTYIIILEADKKRQFNPSANIERLEYHFDYDEDYIFHRTKYINKLLRLTKTTYVAIWDTDAIAVPEQIENAANALRQNQAVLSFPYDGRFYKADKFLTNSFQQTLCYDVMINQKRELVLMYGFYSVGGAFMVNKQLYCEAGGENENIYGWGPEDVERVKRMEILDFPIYRSEGCMFHMWHPIGLNSWYANQNIEIKNRKELLTTCQLIN